MTREEAKKRLEVWLICVNCPEDKRCYDAHLKTLCEKYDYREKVPIEEALKVAIKALEQQPCEDAISRQAAIDAIYARYIGGKEAVDKAPANDHYAEGIDEAVCAVEDLPSVTPQQKIGHWCDEFGGCECSECGCLEAGHSDYCPNCGAKMQEGGEE